MATVTPLEKEVLMYLKSSLAHNRQEGITAKEISNNIDRPMQQVLDACESLDQKDLLDIEKRHMAGGKAQDMEMHISNKGLDFLANDKGIPL
jgi:hypothetical protein